jgi:hypothetical protein
MTEAAPSFSAVGLQIWLHAALQRLLGNCRRAGMGRSGTREAKSNCQVHKGAEGGTMQRVPKSRSRQSAKSRCEMHLRTSVLVPVRHGPPKCAVGHCDCPQICPHFLGELALAAAPCACHGRHRHDTGCFAVAPAPPLLAGG